MPPIDRRAPEFVALVTLTVLAVVPLWVGRFLPLFDYPAHLVVPAALLHASDPTMRIDELYVFRPGLNPNSLHYAVTFLLGHVVSLEAASKVFLSAAVAALPWALVFALRAFGRDWRLVFLGAPLMLGRLFFYGFVGNVAAIPLGLLVLGAVALEVHAPSTRRRWLLAGAMAVLPFAHFFTMLLTFGAAVVVAWREGGRATWRPLLPLCTGPLLMLPWFIGSLLNPSAPAVNDGLPFAHWATFGELLPMLSHWFMDAFVSHVDEAVAVAMVVGLAAFFGASSLTKTTPRSSTPLVLGLVFAAGYFALPFELRRPFNWWAMNVRLVPLAFLWLVIAVPVAELAPRGRQVVLGVAALTAAFFVFVAMDFRSFNASERGLSTVLTAVPKGSTVLGLYTHYRAPMHYLHDEFYYASSYAVVEAGGQAAPFSTIPQAWRDPKRVPPHPPGGDAAQFDFERHAQGFSHFLVRRGSGPGFVRDPLEGDPRVAVVTDDPPWRLYRCVGPGCFVR